MVVGDDRLVESPVFRQRRAEVDTGIGVAGIELEPLPKGDDCLVELMIVEQCDAQVAEPLGGFALELDRPIVRRDCAWPLPRSAVGFTQVGVVMGSRGIDGNRPADQFERRIDVAHLAGQNSEQVQSVGVVGIDREDLTVDCFRFGQSAGLVMFEGDPVPPARP